MNFPGSQLSLSNIDLRTPADQSSRAAGLVNIGDIFGTMRDNDPDIAPVIANRIGIEASRRALKDTLDTNLEIQEKTNDANLDIYKDALVAQRGLAQDEADRQRRSDTGALAGGALGLAGLASGFVGPLAIPLGMAGGKLLSGLFG